MKKKRRRKRKRPGIRKGDPAVNPGGKHSIPWTRDELNETLAWEIKLITTPADDWDLTEPPKVKVEDEETGEVASVGLNQFNPLVQLMRHFYEKYEDPVVVGAHFWRYTCIKSFLGSHRERMLEEGWAETTDDAFTLDSHLLDALCTIPPPAAAEVGEGAPDFDYDTVIAEARRLRDKGPA